MAMVQISSKCTKKDANRGLWTSDEDQRLAQVVEIHGPMKWKSIAIKAGLNRCGKSCRLRWMNYLRPDIKRGNISPQEEDLILRLHKLLGNRWSLIAGRLPGRTDNEIKNYWNSHLSKKINQKEKRNSRFQANVHEQQNSKMMGSNVVEDGDNSRGNDHDSKSRIIEDGLFGCFATTSEGPLNLDWMSKFLELDEGWFDFS